MTWTGARFSNWNGKAATLAKVWQPVSGPKRLCLPGIAPLPGLLATVRLGAHGEAFARVLLLHE